MFVCTLKGRMRPFFKSLFDKQKFNHWSNSNGDDKQHTTFGCFQVHNSQQTKINREKKITTRTAHRNENKHMNLWWHVFDDWIRTPHIIHTHTHACWWQGIFIYFYHGRACVFYFFPNILLCVFVWSPVQRLTNVATSAFALIRIQATATVCLEQLYFLQFHKQSEEKLISGEATVRSEIGNRK